VGLALEALDNLPKYVERGRSQVTLGRFVAKTMTQRGSAMAETLGDRVLNDVGQVIVDIFGIDLSPDDASSADAEPVVKPTATADRPDERLPIAEYDSQAAAQIVKMLGQLTPEELDAIEAHETAGRGRVTILRKIEQLRRAA